MGAADNVSPFSRKMWNEEIIQPINNLCENPPSGCDPIDPLDEAEKDHIWTKKDVQEVHDKLVELCPENEFDVLETPQLDYKTLIEEILEAIARGWCNCEPEEIELGLFTAQFFSHSNDTNKCCGNQDSVYAGFGFCRYWVYTTYHSPYHQEFITDPGEALKRQERTDTYNEARTETIAWIEDREQELLTERYLKGLRDLLDQKKEALQNAQNALDACVINCQDEQQLVDDLKDEIDDLEQEIVQKEIERDDYRDQAEIHLNKADAAATINWQLMTTQQYLDLTSGPDSYGANFMPNTLDLITLSGYSNQPWGLGPYPFYWQQPRTSILLEKTIGGYTSKGFYVGILYTPSGLPFADWNKNYYVDVPYAEWSVVRDTSTYASPPCPALDPAEEGDFARKSHIWAITFDIGDTFKFSKIETSGTRQMEYEDL